MDPGLVCGRHLRSPHHFQWIYVGLGSGRVGAASILADYSDLVILPGADGLTHVTRCSQSTNGRLTAHGLTASPSSLRAGNPVSPTKIGYFRKTIALPLRWEVESCVGLPRVQNSRPPFCEFRCAHQQRHNREPNRHPEFARLASRELRSNFADS